MLEIHLPGAPRGKGRPRLGTDKHGYPKVHTDEKTVAFEKLLKEAAWVAMLQARIRAPLEGPLEVEMVAVMPIAPSWPKGKQADALAGRIRPTATPDCDNILKMMDALNKMVWLDDSQVVRVMLEKHYGAKPALTVRVGRATVAP